MKKTDKDIRALLDQGEGLKIEIKECDMKLPEDLWETYSAFANTRGGEIILGVKEHKKLPKDQRFEIIGLRDANKIVTDFFNMVNNPQKVNRSVVPDSNVQIVEIDGKEVVYIRVPEADYRHKPIYINQKLQTGTYKRVHEGDRRVSERELTMMVRDSFDDVDSQVIPRRTMDDIDPETLRGYRQMFETRNFGHPYINLDNKEFLRKMDGYGYDEERQEEGLTMAGLLLFGKGDSIHKTFRNFRVDYLDLQGIQPGSSKKWNDRLTDDGYWEDNIFNFLLLAMRKLLFTLPSEGRLRGTVRVDGGPLHEAVREAMVNAVTYCDYRAGGVLRFDRRDDRIVLRNPGLLRISPERIYNGDYTQARNGAIQKMLRMVGFGDNIGSGFTKIMNAWKGLGFPSPTIRQEDEVDEVWLTLPLPAGFPIFISVYEKGEETSRRGEETGSKGEEISKKGGETDSKGEEISEKGEETDPKGGETDSKGEEISEKGEENDTKGEEISHNGEEISEKGEETLGIIPEDILISLTDLQKQLLTLIIQKPTISFKQLGQELGMTEKALRIQRAKIEKANIQWIREGSTKAGKWIVNINNNKN